MARTDDSLPIVMNRRWLVPLLVLSLAILFASIEATGVWLRDTIHGVPQSWTTAARQAFTVWLTFIVLVPVPVWMARRHPIGARHATAKVLAHLAAAVAFCVAHLTLIDVVFRLLDGGSRTPPLASLAWRFGQYFAVELFIYWGIAGSIMLIQRERDLREREVASERLAGSLRQATLDALRAKLHPHFLYNTLNAISVLALKGESQAVARATGHLGALLRATLDEQLPQQIPLARELELLNRYLEIQRLRFPDRLQVEHQVGPEALDALVPCFVLQPLVENAIQHGLAAANGGWIRIAAERRDGWLELEVSDSGSGFPVGATDGIGLANTRARLAQLYGEAGRLVPGSAPDGGGRVQLRIPYQGAPAGADSESAG
jgi:signal transduction histidine kinase